jgi:hypothetical protein
MASGLFGVLVPLRCDGSARIPAPHRASSSLQEPISPAWDSCWHWRPCSYFRLAIAKIAGLLTREDQYVRLTPPKRVTFYLSVSLALISVMIETMAVTGLTLFPTGRYFFGGYLVLLWGYLVLVAGNALKGV